MNEPDLFDQLREARDDGIQRAIDHAEEVEPGWGDAALALLRLYAASGRPFTALALREWAQREHGFVGATNWAWGSVFVRAQRDRLIEKAGFAEVGNETSHLKVSPLWKAVA